MSEIITWVRSGDSLPETYFVATYGSFEQEQMVKFYSREQYQKYLEDSYSVSYLVDYWNAGDCQLIELRWLPEISTAHPMWAEVAQNTSPDGQNYVPLSQQIELIIQNRYAEILSGEILQFSFLTAEDQYFAHTTGVVKP